MWLGVILPIKTFFKAKNVVGESTGGASWWKEDEHIWKTLIYFNIEST